MALAYHSCRDKCTFTRSDRKKTSNSIRSKCWYQNDIHLQISLTQKISRVSYSPKSSVCPNPYLSKQSLVSHSPSWIGSKISTRHKSFRAMYLTYKCNILYHFVWILDQTYAKNKPQAWKPELLGGSSPKLNPLRSNNLPLPYAMLHERPTGRRGCSFLLSYAISYWLRIIFSFVVLKGFFEFGSFRYLRCRRISTFCAMSSR